MAIPLPNAPPQRPLTCSSSSCSRPTGVAGVEAEVAAEVDGGVEAEASISRSPRGDAHPDPGSWFLRRTRETRPVAGSRGAWTRPSRHFRERGVEFLGVAASEFGGREQTEVGIRPACGLSLPRGIASLSLLFPVSVRRGEQPGDISFSLFRGRNRAPGGGRRGLSAHPLGHLLSMDRPPLPNFRLAAWGVGSAGSAASSPTCRLTLGEPSHRHRHGQGGEPLPAG